MTTKAERQDLAQLMTAWDVADAELLPPLKEGDLTIKDYASKNGLKESQARSVLERLVANGKLTRVSCRGRLGVKTLAYRLPK